MSLILENVSFSYESGGPSEQAALQQISFTVENGEFVAIMGRTGCGKSTLIQLAAGLLTPGRGRILLDGQDINAAGYPREELRRRIGVVFQYPEYQLFETTVEKDVAFGLKYFPLSKQEKHLRVKQALETMGFSYDQIRDHSPLSLSGGEKRRVAAAGILAMKPSILILDEPAAGLDPSARTAFLQILQKLNQQGVTILMITHDADVVAEFAGRLMILKDGRLVRDDTPRNIFSHPRDLDSLDINVSTPRRIACMLGQKGIAIPQDIIRYQELRSVVLAAVQARQGTLGSLPN